MNFNFDDIYENHEHYKIFPIIYSIKHILEKYSDRPSDLCQLCFIYKSSILTGNYDEDEDVIDEYEHINLIMAKLLNNELIDINDSSIILCNGCRSDYSKHDIFDLVQTILNYSYHYEGITRFNEFVKLFDRYASNPYEKLLLDYFSYNMSDYYMYHKNCEHYTGTSNKPDNKEILCPKILDIINHITDLYYVDFLNKCPTQYIKILIDKGIDINHLFENNETVFDGLLYGFISDCYHNYNERIETFIKFGLNVNAGKPHRHITGIQYENRPEKIKKIKYLKKIGVNFDNKCISYCDSADKCKFHKMLYDTRLGKLIQSL